MHEKKIEDDDDDESECVGKYAVKFIVYFTSPHERLHNIHANMETMFAPTIIKCKCSIESHTTASLMNIPYSVCKADSNNLISGNYRHMISISSHFHGHQPEKNPSIGSIKSDRISYYFVRRNFIYLALGVTCCVDVKILILLNKQDYSFVLL